MLIKGKEAVRALKAKNRCSDLCVSFPPWSCKFGFSIPITLLQAQALLHTKLRFQVANTVCNSLLNSFTFHPSFNFFLWPYFPHYSRLLPTIFSPPPYLFPLAAQRRLVFSFLSPLLLCYIFTCPAARATLKDLESLKGLISNPWDHLCTNRLFMVLIRGGALGAHPSWGQFADEG